MESLPLETHIRRADEDADRYEATVHVLLTFAAYVTHDGRQRRPRSLFGFGRRMDMCRARPESECGDVQSDSDEKLTDEELSATGTTPQAEVTPDLVAQKSPTLGIVAEVKAGMSDSDDVWDDYIGRLESYDTRLAGWWTDTAGIEKSIAILLIHRSKSRRLVRALKKRISEGDVSLSRNTAVIEFVRSDQVDTYYSFRSEWGQVQDPDLGPRLYDSVEVPLKKVIQEFSAIQFYDAEPPLPMMLEILWGEFFGQIEDLEYDEETKSWPLGITVDAVTSELQKAYGSGALHCDHRSCEFPRATWVRRALDTLSS